MIRRRSLCIALLLLVLVASACSKSTHRTNPTSSTSTTSSTGATPTGANSAPTTTSEPTTTSKPDATSPSTTPVTGISSTRLPPVGVGVQSELANKIFVTVTRITPQTLGARGPTETSGPGVIVTLEVRNATTTSFDLNGLAINAHYGNGIPAVPNHVPGDPLVGALAPGQHRTGLYEFRIANGEASTVVIDIEHASAPNVVIVDNAH